MSSAETAAYVLNNVAEENLGGIVLTVAEQLMPPVGERNRNLADRSNIEGIAAARGISFRAYRCFEAAT